MKNETNVIGFIGCGNMARAIVRALHEQGYKSLFVYDKNSSQAQAVSDFVNIAKDAQAVVDAAKVIFVCVKPQAAQEALAGLNFSDKILVSIMAGTPIDRLKAISECKKVVRVMPNMNAEVKLSYNAFVCDGLNDTEKTEIHDILSAFGMAQEYTEDMLSAVTGLAGSGPAFVFRFFKGLLTEAQKYDFSPAAAIELCGMMIAGSVGTVLHSVFKEPPASFLEAIEKLDAKTDSVCSQKGTTIEGVQFLDNNNFDKTVSEAVFRAIARAEELSQ